MGVLSCFSSCIGRGDENQGGDWENGGVQHHSGQGAHVTGDDQSSASVAKNNHQRKSSHLSKYSTRDAMQCCREIHRSDMEFCSSVLCTEFFKSLILKLSEFVPCDQTRGEQEAGSLNLGI